MVGVAGPDRRFLFLSESVRNLTGGRDPASMLGQTVLEQVHPDDVPRVERLTRESRERAAKAVAAGAEGGGIHVPQYVPYRLRGAAGDYAWRNFTTTVDGATGTAFAVCVASDTAFARQHAALVDLLEELGDDMRAPLAAISERLHQLAGVPGLASDPDAVARFACVEHGLCTLESLAGAARAVARRERAKLAPPQAAAGASGGASAAAAASTAPRRNSTAAEPPAGVVRFSAERLLEDVVGMCRLGCRKGAAGVALVWSPGGPPPGEIMVRETAVSCPAGAL